MKIRVAILISGSGSNMAALLAEMELIDGCQPVLVLANDPGAGGLQKAANLGVPVAVADHRDHDSRAAFEAAIYARLKAARADIICLAGFMRILSPDFVHRYPDRILNIHPSLLPKYKGLNTHKRALQAGDAKHGCSVHLVTPTLDDGPVLGQAQVPVQPGDTAETLAARVLKMEHLLYPAVMRRFVRGDRTPVRLP